jgi:hypothetical protein
MRLSIDQAQRVTGDKLAYLGKGAFSTAFMNITNDTVLITSEDPIKETMAYGWFPTSKHVPLVEKLDDNLYEMPYYTVCTSWQAYRKILTDESNQMLSELIAMYQRCCRTFSYNHHDYSNLWWNNFDTMHNKELGDLLKGMLSGASNCGSDICFELRPDNMAADKDGNLILLDCFFQWSLLPWNRDKQNAETFYFTELRF